MTPDMIIGLLVFAGMLVLVLLGVPIFLSMLAGSFVGFILLGGIRMMVVQFTTAPFSLGANYTYAVLPLFMLVGSLASVTGIAQGAFDSMRSYDWKRTLKEHNLIVHDDDKFSTRFFTRTLRCLTGCEARTTILGYTQRGRQPSAYDSWFAFEAGNLAVNLLRNGIGNQVIGVKDGRVFFMPIDDALKQKREFNLNLYNTVNEL